MNGQQYRESTNVKGRYDGGRYDSRYAICQFYTREVSDWWIILMGLSHWVEDMIPGMPFANFLIEKSLNGSLFYWLSLIGCVTEKV